MQLWINFWIILLWILIFSFIFNAQNFIKLLICSELVWVVIYCYTLFCGVINDDITLLSTGFFVLGLAGLEFSIGLLLIILFKNLNKSIFLDNEKMWTTNKFINKNKKTAKQKI